MDVIDDTSGVEPAAKFRLSERDEVAVIRFITPG
jgi:hypothetical protein